VSAELGVPSEGDALLEGESLIVRREAWEAVGDLCEGVLHGAEEDLCRRIERAGWTVVRRERTDRRTLRELVRDGAARAWLDRRWWDAPRTPRARGRGPLGALAGQIGYLLENTPPRRLPARGECDLVELVDDFPELSQTFIAEELRALRIAGRRPRVEATFRARRPSREAARDVRVDYLEDDGILRKLRALAWLGGRHPWRCARDLLERRRWTAEEEVPPLRRLAPPARRLARGGEPHLHAHFGTGAALSAMRLGRLLGIPHSVALNGFDIYQSPANLRDKLERAAFAVTPSEYSTDHVRALAPGADLHTLVVGVDPERLRRRRPHPGGRTVLAVGRLLEKKGFAHLIDAVALLEGEVERALIVGEGPLREALERRIRERGVAGTVELLGPREPAEVRELLEEADVVAVPCVVAADGDRDTMPVVAKEALAMEVPVVASDEVGLPELVRPEWGRLVPPADPPALAAAIAELLRLPVEQRAEMGRAGRKFVSERCNLLRETERLSALIDGRGAAPAEAEHERPVPTATRS